MDGRISVIVPIYNVENYLDMCIKSILNQTYSNLEIILVDDGSPDNCGSICEKYASKDDRIKVIHKKNGGLSDARNVGVLAATGDFISFIDADDYIDLKFYEIMMNLMINNNVDIVQCDYEMVYENKFDVIEQMDANYKELIYVKEFEILNNLYNENYGRTVVVWNKLYKRWIFEELNFPIGKHHEDELTTYKVLHRAKRFLITDRKLYYYVQRENSIMGNNFNYKRLDIIDAYYNQIHFFAENNLIELKEKAINRLEAIVRGSMNRVIIYNIDNKNKILTGLIEYYKENLYLFNLVPSSFKTKIVRSIIQYLPNPIIRYIYIVFNRSRKKYYET
ncbi:glycosyltransferase [Bacillus sp. MB2021]|uniref:glycosyltransferase n=1 Tax=Bacillus sp. MB2021 TaxID=1408303 RepID=UPI000557AF90|nr:glycosyltransferase [Bacillus sp. MB2021]